MVESTIDPASLPLPTAVPDGSKPNHPVEHLSVIFSQKEASNVLRISKKATTPFWLGKRMYEKLNTDIKFKLGPIDAAALEKSYNDFQKGPAVQDKKLVAKQMYEALKHPGLDSEQKLLKQHKLQNYLKDPKWHESSFVNLTKDVYKFTNS